MFLHTVGLTLKRSQPHNVVKGVWIRGDMRKILCAIIFCLGIAALFSIDQWHLIHWRAEKNIELNAALKLYQIRLKHTITSRFNAIESLASLFVLHPKTSGAEFSQFAEFLLKYNPPIRAVQYADSSTRVIYVYPAKNNEITINNPMTLITDPKRGPFVKKAIQKKTTILQGPFELRQGGTGVVARFPIFREGEFIGLAIGVYDIPELTKEALYGLNYSQFDFHLKDNQGNIFWSSGNTMDDFLEKELNVAGATWKVAANWKKILPPPVFPRALICSLGIALLVAILISLHIAWRQEQQLKEKVEERTKDLSNSNKNLLVEIAERKQAENELRNSESRFKSLQEASFGGISIHHEGIILDCNQGLSVMTGYSINELTGMNILLLISEKSRDVVMNNILCGYEKPYQAIGLRKDGEEFPMHLEARNIPYKGKSARVVEFRDITVQKLAEEERDRLKDQLMQAQKMESIGRLAGGVAHDFNNMLTVILGYTQAAIDEMDPSEPLYHNLQEVFSSAQRSADLTKQLLTFARKQIIDPKILDLNQSITQIITMLKRLIGEDIDLLWKPAENLWPVKIDPSQIDQILTNLCVNARDAIPDVGKITIETGMVSFDEVYCTEHPGFIPGDFVLLAVSDDGVGMDKETLNNLFEPFFTTKDKEKGTGLGLATVYGSVKQNNGFIMVYSEPNQGTIFKIYFSRYIPKGGIPKMILSRASSPGGNETILLVEDEPAILSLTRMLLERLGYKVLAAATPVEAIRLANEHNGNINLLMTDVVMPEMNGRDLSRKLTSIYTDLKCLFMSGYTANVIAHQGVLDEGVAFIQKPFSKTDLAVKIRSVLDAI